MLFIIKKNRQTKIYLQTQISIKIKVRNEKIHKKFNGGNFPGGNFLGDNFSGRQFSGEQFSRGIFPGGIFPWVIFLQPVNINSIKINFVNYRAVSLQTWNKFKCILIKQKAKRSDKL